MQFALIKLDSPGILDQRKVSKMVVTNNFFVFGTTDGSILRWNADNDEQDEVEIISKRTDDAFNLLSVDSTGNHVFISLMSGDNYYVHSKSNKPKKLSRFQGIVESVAFGLQSLEALTKPFMIGTSLGCIYELNVDSAGKEKVNQLVYQLDSPMSITSIHFEVFSASDNTTVVSDTKLFALFATANPTRIYHCLGGPSIVQLFTDGREELSSFIELPGLTQRAEFHCFSRKFHSRAQFFALMTGIGIYTGPLHVGGFAQDNESQLLHYNNSVRNGTDRHSIVPFSIAATEYHFFMLCGTRLQAMERLSGDIVQDEPLRNIGEACGVVKDNIRGFLWLYTKQGSIYQLRVENEDIDVWKIYLQRALAAGDERLFDVAISHCKKENRYIVYREQANFFMARGQLERAAAVFTLSGLPFDDVILRLFGVQSKEHPQSISNSVTETDESVNSKGRKNSVKCLKPFIVTNSIELSAVRVYLEDVLRSLAMTSKSQRTMICIWLCEVYAHQIISTQLSLKTANRSFTGRSDSSDSELIGKFKDFLRFNKASLDPTTTMGLLSARGSRPLMMFYAQIIGDYEKVVYFFLDDKKYTDAIGVLSDAPFERVESIIYKVAPICFEKEPEATVGMLRNKSRLDISRLLPALLRYCEKLDKHVDDKSGISSLNVDFQGNQVNFAVFFVKDCLEMCGEEPEKRKSLIHIMLFLLAKYDDEKETGLQEFLLPFVDSYAPVGEENESIALDLQIATAISQYKEKVETIFDYDYGLQLCKMHKRNRSCVLIYILMGMDRVALVNAFSLHIDLAKYVASRPVSHRVKKPLWVDIARHVVNSNICERNDQIILKTMRESRGILQIEVFFQFFFILFEIIFLSIFFRWCSGCITISS